MSYKPQTAFINRTLNWLVTCNNPNALKKSAHNNLQKKIDTFVDEIQGLLKPKGVLLLDPREVALKIKTDADKYVSFRMPFRINDDMVGSIFDEITLAEVEEEGNEFNKLYNLYTRQLTHYTNATNFYIDCPWIDNFISNKSVKYPISKAEAKKAAVFNFSEDERKFIANKIVTTLLITGEKFPYEITSYKPFEWRRL